MTLEVQPFLHASTSSWSYVLIDGGTRHSAVVDPVLDFDAKSGRMSTESADAIVAFIRGRSLANQWILETHAHADHLSAAMHLKAAVGGQVAIGEGIREVQRTFSGILNLGAEFVADGRQFDRLLADGEELEIGSLCARAIATPGHTSDSLSYQVADAVFVGDAIFMPDSGTGRCDFPGGDARVLYASILRLHELPPSTRVFVGHDYGPGGRAACCETTIAAERAHNIHLRDGVTEQEFVEMRMRRDAGLEAPALLYPAVQFNIRGGRVPPAESNDRHYLKLPLSGTLT
ncbi:MAG: MBL fold metallo-hydrolase [Steroidobacteraceae bacterium]